MKKVNRRLAWQVDFPLSEVLPDRGFLRQHFELLRPCTNAPNELVYYAGLFVLGTVLQRRVGLPWFGFSMRYGNQFQLWIDEELAEHGTGLQEYLRGLLAEVHEVKPGSGATADYVLPRRCTPLQLFRVLEEQPWGALIWTDLRTTIEETRRAKWGPSFGKVLCETVCESPDLFRYCYRGRERALRHPCASVNARTSAADFIRLAEHPYNRILVSQFQVVAPNPRLAGVRNLPKVGSAAASGHARTTLVRWLQNLQREFPLPRPDEDAVEVEYSGNAWDHIEGWLVLNAREEVEVREAGEDHIAPFVCAAQAHVIRNAIVLAMSRDMRPGHRRGDGRESDPPGGASQGDGKGCVAGKRAEGAAGHMPGPAPGLG